MKIKQKAINAYYWLVEKVKGHETKTVTIGAIIGGISAVIASYLLRNVELTVLKYFQIVFSPLGFFTLVIGFVAYWLYQIAISTERISVIQPLTSTIVTTTTIFGGVLILGEPLNITKLIGIVMCIIGIWVIHKNHSKL